MVTDIYFILLVIDMNNNQKIELKYEICYDLFYCSFNLKGEFILCGNVRIHGTFGDHTIIWIYSTQTRNNEWTLKRFYEVPWDDELISISKYDKVYLSSNYYIYEWDILTEKSVKIFDNNEVINIVNYF